MRSELYFDNASGEQNKAMFDRLLDVRERFETAFGGPLLFDRMDDRKACRIESASGPAAIENRDEWHSYIDWMVDTQTRLRAALAAVGGLGYTAGS